MSPIPSFPNPSSVDVVIFSAKRDSLQVLLVKRPTRADEPFPGSLGPARWLRRYRRRTRPRELCKAQAARQNRRRGVLSGTAGQLGQPNA